MKPTEHPNCGNRRHFIRASLRGVALVGMTTVTALLAKRSGGKLTGQACVNRGICSRCSVYAGCGLPAALSAKAAKRGDLS